MDAQNITNIILGVFGSLGAGAAMFERVRSSRSADRARIAREEANLANQKQENHEQIILQKNELINLAKDAVKTWKEKYEMESSEFKTYREKAHDLANTAQAKVLRLSEENAELLAKTDLTPVLAFHKQQSEINGQVLTALGAIVAHLDLNTGKAKEAR